MKIHFNDNLGVKSNARRGKRRQCHPHYFNYPDLHSIYYETSHLIISHESRVALKIPRSFRSLNIPFSKGCHVWIFEFIQVKIND